MAPEAVLTAIGAALSSVPRPPPGSSTLAVNSDENDVMCSPFGRVGAPPLGSSTSSGKVLPASSLLSLGLRPVYASSDSSRPRTASGLMRRASSSACRCSGSVGEPSMTRGGPSSEIGLGAGSSASGVAAAPVFVGWPSSTRRGASGVDSAAFATADQHGRPTALQSTHATASFTPLITPPSSSMWHNATLWSFARLTQPHGSN